MKKVGLIAGSGNFPKIFAQNAIKKGVRVYTAAIREETCPDIAEYSHKLKWFNLGDLRKAILFFTLNGVKHLAMAGKVRKIRVFSDFDKDDEVQDIFDTIKNKKDNSLLRGVINKVEKFGFKFLDSTMFLDDCLAPVGQITERQITDKEQKDIDFGFDVAKSISDLDIGQTVIIKDTVVVAVEAVEGTNAAIKRAGALAGEGAVVVKVSRPDQDMRFDVPVVGEETIDVLIKNKIGVLAIEAGKTLFLDKDIVVKKADEAGIGIVGVVKSF